MIAHTDDRAEGFDPDKDMPAPLAPGQIGPQAWLTAPETVAVYQALTKEGADARFVGGCVRDGLMARPVKDIDLATPDRPEKVISLLEQAGIKAIPTGIDHGTITAVINKIPFEITTLRRDVSTDGRRATIEFTNSWQEDAKRRDFTINSLSCNLQGEVFDPLDVGMEDIARGIVKFIGEATDRVEEDYLRILRYFRFLAICGRHRPDKSSLGACRKYAHKLTSLSGERVWQEIERLLMVPNSADMFQTMRGARILDAVLPEVQHPGILRILTWLETTALMIDDIAPDPIRRFAALLEGTAEDAKVAADRLRLSNKDRDRLIALKSPPVPITHQLEKTILDELLYRHGKDRVIDWILLGWAGKRQFGEDLNSTATTNWKTLLDQALTWQEKTFPLTGQDLLDAGYDAGPKIGEILKETEDWWIGEGFQPDKDACLRQAQLLK